MTEGLIWKIIGSRWRRSRLNGEIGSFRGSAFDVATETISFFQVTPNCNTIGSKTGKYAVYFLTYQGLCDERNCDIIS